TGLDSQWNHGAARGRPTFAKAHEEKPARAIGDLEQSPFPRLEAVSPHPKRRGRGAVLIVRDPDGRRRGFGGIVATEGERRSRWDRKCPGGRDPMALLIRHGNAFRVGIAGEKRLAGVSTDDR